MFQYIKGKTAGSFAGGIVLENNGIGFQLHVPAGSALQAARPGTEMTAYTYMAVREDDISLYGFDTLEELNLFCLLITVSGIGSKAAISILSSLSPREIRSAVVFEDPAAFTKAQGVGKKTASRIVLELKDRIEAVSIDGASDAASRGGEGIPDSSGPQTDAVEALMSLGYSKAEASEAVGLCGSEYSSPEEYIRDALKTLSRL